MNRQGIISINRAFFFSPSPYAGKHVLIIYVDTKEKCLHLKKLICKGTLRLVFIRVYRVKIPRDVVSLGWPIGRSYMSHNAGWGGGVAKSPPMSTAVHRSPNKLWRSNSIFNLREIQPVIFEFSTQLCNCCPSNLLSSSTLTPLSCVKVHYIQKVCDWEGIGGVESCWRPYSAEV